MEEIDENYYEAFGNVYGKPHLVYGDHPEDDAVPEFTYMLFLILPDVKFLLKKAVHTDIVAARSIAFDLFLLEWEWLTFQPDSDCRKNAGVVLVFKQADEEKENIIVESSFAGLDKTTELYRKEERAVFKRLGKKYPKRNFDLE